MTEMNAPEPQPLAPLDEIARLKEQLHQTELAYYMAVQASQLKGSFLARTSHELRSPLNGMIGMHQLILADLCDSSEEEREFVEQANASALKLVKLLDEVIDLTRVAQGTNQLAMQPVPLAKLLEDVQRLTYLQAKNRNLSLAIAFPSPDLYVLTDLPRSRQLLVSLVDTAIAHLDEGSLSLTVQLISPTRCVIQIETPIPAATWRLDSPQPPTSISNGAVVPLEKATILQTANRPFPTLGFALAVARSLLQSMQGNLEVNDVHADAASTTSQICCELPVVDLEASID